MKGSVSRIEGVDFQDWSAQMFRNLGFEVKNQVYSDSDHTLSLDGQLAGVISAKNWTLKDRNKTVNDSRIGPELKRVREAKISLIVHVYNKKTDRNWSTEDLRKRNVSSKKGENNEDGATAGI